MPRVIGVIGGMGPEATLAFAQRVYALAPSAVEQARPRLLIDCNPAVPDRNLALAGKGPSPAGTLESMARGLVRAGAQVLVMPCNTAHAFSAKIATASPVPFVSIIDSTAQDVAAQAPEAVRIGLLATTALIAAGLYQRALEAWGKAVVVPASADQAELMALIYAIKAGGDLGESRSRMAAIAKRLVERGAEAIVAACTEVPLVLGARDLDVALIDSTDALARSALRQATTP